MKNIMWFLATTISVAAIAYFVGTFYLKQYPNTDTTIPHGSYSEVLATAQQKDQHTLLIFTVAGAAFGSLLGVIKIKGE